MMLIPQSDSLPTAVMNRVFDNTVATYKFYWLLSLLDMHVKEGKSEMFALDVASRMVAYAWYPVEYFKLWFGKGDSLWNIIDETAKLTTITVDDRLEDKVNTIQTAVREDRRVKGLVMKLLDNVPFWFLSPWINKRDKRELSILSQTFTNGCIYALSGWGENLKVTINPQWSIYLQTNYQVLYDFALWNLARFLQARNPNVPNIAGKLLRPEKRASLKRQKEFWNKVIEMGCSINCIYTNDPLEIGDFALDHFMPWSFVSHDQNWNLVPAKESSNSSKSNRIPDLDYYLPKMAAIQHKALQLYIPACHKSKDSVLDDYFTLGVSPRVLMEMSEEAFLRKYYDTYQPLYLMATNMGFRTLTPQT